MLFRTGESALGLELAWFCSSELEVSLQKRSLSVNVYSGVFLDSGLTWWAWYAESSHLESSLLFTFLLVETHRLIEKGPSYNEFLGCKNSSWEIINPNNGI